MSHVPAKEATELILSGYAPASLKTDVLDLSFARAKRLVALPANLSCFYLCFADQPIVSLPPGLRVEFKLDLTGCSQLTQLPADLSVSTLVLTNCVSLTSLPRNLKVNFLQLDGCTSLRSWPASSQVRNGWVRARGCTALEQLPAGLGPLASLDLRGCQRISQIPENVAISSWVDIGGTKITGLPESLRGIGLRWRGVPVSAQIAFFPETLHGRDILTERNAELRRVMIERVGFAKFLEETKAKVIDTDRDRGGERKLFRVPLEGDEPIVVVSVNCPSTGRQYLIRVPPDTRTCHQAVAWTAGFDNPDDYAPVEET